MQVRRAVPWSADLHGGRRRTPPVPFGGTWRVMPMRSQTSRSSAGHVHQGRSDVRRELALDEVTYGMAVDNASRLSRPLADPVPVRVLEGDDIASVTRRVAHVEAH